MPTYEYECIQCGERFEEFQSITAKPLRRIKTDCADCNNSAPVKRLIGSGAAVVFKGSGFYQTDYRSDSYKKAAKAETDGESGTKSKSSKDGDSPSKSKSKGESKSDSKTTSSSKNNKE